MNRRMIRVHAIDAKGLSIFTDKSGVPDDDIAIVDSPDEAQVIVAGRIRALTGALIRPDALHVVWTNEPGDYYRGFIKNSVFPGIAGPVAIHVFNAHNGMVYTDNFLYAPVHGRMRPVRDASGLNTRYEDKTLTFASIYRSRMPAGLAHVTLVPRRQQWALELHSQGRARIMGPRWPAGVAESESRRDADRHQKKMDFLGTSNFSLCLENTIADYYVTEKIWEAIKGGALPIYYDNGTIYQTFPKDSFIDASLFSSAAELARFIDELSLDEYIARINACRRVYNHAGECGLKALSKERTRRRLLEFVREMVAA